MLGRADWLTPIADAMVVRRRNNDPAAGSPTATLLRLLLPLDKQICTSSAQPRQLPNNSQTSKTLTYSSNR